MWLFLFFALGAAAATQPAASAEKCLHYMGDPVALEGHVTLRTFFGPPNYGEQPTNDSKERQAILRLSNPICVIANSRDSDVAEQDQSEVTLVPINGENLRRYQGKAVNVRGTLFHANTGHHHTPVLIEIEHIQSVRSNNSFKPNPLRSFKTPSAPTGGSA